MRQIPVQLLNHYKGTCLTLAKIWKVIREDGVVFGFTDIDKDIEYGGITYKASTGFIPSAIETKSNFGVDNMDVQSVLNDESITETDIKLGLWDGARIEMREVNYEDLSMGASILRIGYLGEVKTGRQTFYGELRGLIQRLQTQVGRIYQPACDANLGDARCTINLDPLRVTLTITSVLSATSFTVDPASVSSFDATYFTNGLIEMLSGSNQGFKNEVAQYDKVTGRFTSYVPLPYFPQVGDTFLATPGCLKDEAACKRFGNYLNFQGFPDVPGADKIMSGG